MEGQILASFEALYRAEAGPLMQALRPVQPDAASREDAVVFAFTALWRKLERGDQIDNPVALLRTIAERRAIDLVRSDEARRRVEIPVGGIEELAEISDRLRHTELTGHRPTTYEDIEFTEDFDGALRALEDDERDAYILTELRGLSSYEAADLLDTSYKTVQRRAESARQLIREEIRA